MKNLIIVDAYQNNIIRQQALQNCLSQLKKSGYDILLTTNAKELPTNITELCNYCVYNDDNTLLPIETSPSCWFADYEDYITINGKAATYVIVKKLALGLSIAKTMGYTNFLFIEYDCIIHDEDLPKITQLFDRLKEKKAVFFHFWDDGFPISESNPIGFETLVFGGNVNFFIDNMEFPVTYEQWLLSSKYTTGYNALEYKFPVLLQSELHNIDVITDLKSPTYFSKSNMDLFSNRYDVHLLMDSNSSERAMLFVIGNNDRTVIILDGVVHFDEITPKNQWKKIPFSISSPVAVEIRCGNTQTKYTVSQENIQMYSTGTTERFTHKS